MKYTESKDGKLRANINIALRFTKEEFARMKKTFENKTIKELKRSFKMAIIHDIDYFENEFEEK